MTFYKNGCFAADPWDQGLDTPARRPLLTVDELRARRGQEVVGVKLDPGFDVETLTGLLDAVELVTITFPKFTDGRGYSMAKLLRTRLRYRHELRAVGDVLFDEMQFMLRCGFDAFEVVDPSTLELLSDGRRPSFDRFYQPGLEPEVPEGTRPWARRSA